MRPHRHPRGKSRRDYDPTSHRLRELERIICYRHGTRLDTDDADIYLVAVAQTLRRIYEKWRGAATTEDVLDRLKVWAERRTIRIPDDMLRDCARAAVQCRSFETADSLAKRLRLKYAERMLLKITTIGACDVDKVGRTRLRKERKRRRDRARAAAKRAASGAVQRPQYLALCLSRVRPWEAEGISRRTWERHRRKGTLMAVASVSPSTLAIGVATDLRHCPLAPSEMASQPSQGSRVAATRTAKHKIGAIDDL